MSKKATAGGWPGTPRARARCRRDELIAELAGCERDILPTLVRGDPALATGFTRFFAAPLMRTAFLVRHSSTLAGNLALLIRVHRRESTIFLAHVILQCPMSGLGIRIPGPVGCNRCALERTHTETWKLQFYRVFRGAEIADAFVDRKIGTKTVKLLDQESK